MAELTTEQRERLKASDFAYVDRSGERHLPIHDEEHVRNAIAALRADALREPGGQARRRAEDPPRGEEARHRRRHRRRRQPRGEGTWLSTGRRREIRG